jgi:hypothetical protein
MKAKKSTELNDKIAQVIEASGMTSSIFADYIGLPRPIMSHIVAKRNKATLEIVQKILTRFPELGIAWTFDGTPLKASLLNKLATSNTTEESTSSLNEDDDLSLEQKNVLRLIELNEDRTFTNYNPSSSSTTPNSSMLPKGISKIVVFFDDDSFVPFQPA